jgi:hypothetical protein
MTLLSKREHTMKLYNDMPDCLEKSLYKLNYYTEILISKAKENIIKETEIDENDILQLTSAI